jgi:hypothetical protein
VPHPAAQTPEYLPTCRPSTAMRRCDRRYNILIFGSWQLWKRLVANQQVPAGAKRSGEGLALYA